MLYVYRYLTLYGSYAHTIAMYVLIHELLLYLEYALLPNHEIPPDLECKLLVGHELQPTCYVHIVSYGVTRPFTRPGRISLKINYYISPIQLNTLTLMTSH